MKPQNQHAQEDRLLDFVYGELPPLEARAVESHVEGCSRCSELLAGIRGVRTTMAQLPMEPAPDAGLESLLAYAQQAARNAAAGPAPTPTWWRRWLIPLVGVAAVSVFGLVTLRVSKSVDLRVPLPEKSEATRAEAPAPVVTEAKVPAAPTPAPAQAPAQVQAQAQDEEYAARSNEGDSYQHTAKPTYAGATPPMDAPAPQKKAFTSGSKSLNPDWSNVGTAERKAKSYDDPRRDAQTQAWNMQKSKPMAALQGGSALKSAPEPAPEPKLTTAPAQEPAQAAKEEASANGMLAESEVRQQQVAQRGSLRLNGTRTRQAESPDNAQGASTGADFDDLVSDKASLARREQPPPKTAALPPPPAPPAAAAPAAAAPVGMASAGAAPMPSMPSESKGRATGPSASELSQQAQAAAQSGDRVLEAALLRQALVSGATGSERLGLLSRLCDAEIANGRSEAAKEACELVIQESPNSRAAQVARARLSRLSPDADVAKARPGSRDSGKAAAKKDMERQEAPASAPAEAY